MLPSAGSSERGQASILLLNSKLYPVEVQASDGLIIERLQDRVLVLVHRWYPLPDTCFRRMQQRCPLDLLVGQ